MKRRDFLKAAGVSGSALMVGLWGGSLHRQLMAGSAASAPFSPHPLLMIDEAGKVLIYAYRPEMGQGTFQSIPAIIADELEVKWEDVRIEIAPGDPKFGRQDVAGSTSIRGNFDQLRKIGAAAREMLTEAAAKQWGVPKEQCYASEGRILLKGESRQLGYGELIQEAAKLEVPQKPALKSPENFRFIGKVIPRPDVEEKVNGKAVFGIDVQVPGMLHAVVEHCPTFKGKILGYDKQAALAVTGVKHVLETDRLMRNGDRLPCVAVVADSHWAAQQARKKLNVRWDTLGQEAFSTSTFEETLKKRASEPGIADVTTGDFEGQFSKEKKKVSAFYQTPFVSHSPMEPMNVVAQVKDGYCDLWISTQIPGRVRQEIAGYLGIPEDHIRIHMTYIGGGFGRRLFADYITEAVSLSRQLDGAPIKVIWTREDDTQQGPFRPAIANQLDGAVDAQGNLIALRHKVIGPSISYQVNPKADKNKADGGMMSGTSSTPYEIPHFQTSMVLEETHVPIGWWRSVYASNNVFPHESFLDELAILGGKDPLDFRLSLLKNQPRYAKALQLLAEKVNWYAPKQKGKGKGVAISNAFGSICAHCVEVTKEKNGGIRIDKVTCVVDCGVVVNPDTVVGQTEGNVIFALTAALKKPITFEKGAAVQGNFDQYPLLGIHETPPIEVVIMDSQEAPGGVGETALPAIAPALTNAIFQATGKRIRTLPFDIAQVSK